MFSLSVLQGASEEVSSGPYNCLELKRLAGKSERLKSSLSSRYLMTSQGVGLSPAPTVRQQSPENVRIPETPPQSLDIIYRTCLKCVLNVSRLKVPVPRISLRESSSNSWWQSSVRASVSPTQRSSLHDCRR